MAKRTARQDIIREVIRRGAVRTQRDLVEQLRAEGYDCTQATVSRDISGMGLAKAADGRYVLPEDLRLQRMVGEMAESVRAVGNFVVVLTPPGVANGVAAALDGAQLKGIAGTIAGDDTIFALCSDEEAAENVAATLEKLLKKH